MTKWRGSPAASTGRLGKSSPPIMRAFLFPPGRAALQMSAIALFENFMSKAIQSAALPLVRAATELMVLASAKAIRHSPPSPLLI